MIKQFLVGILLFGTAIPCLAAEQRPFQITVFGDSGTKAFIADSTVGFPGPRFKFSFFRAIFAGLFAKKPNIDDPIAYYESVDRTYGFLSRTYLSAFLGRQFYSLPFKIAEQTNRKVEVLDLARLGSGYFATEPLKELADKTYRKRGFPADLLVVNFFGIDFVLNEPLARFRADVRSFFQWATKAHPEQAMLVTTFPDLVDLVTQADQVAVPDRDGQGGYKCSELIERMHFADQLGLYPGQTGPVVADASRKLNKMNAILKDEIDKLEKREHPYDQYAGEVVLVSSERDNFRWKDYLAADCIHPNQQSQRLLAETVWDAVAWMF